MQNLLCHSAGWYNENITYFARPFCVGDALLLMLLFLRIIHVQTAASALKNQPSNRAARNRWLFRPKKSQTIFRQCFWANHHLIPRYSSEWAAICERNRKRKRERATYSDNKWLMTYKCSDAVISLSACHCFSALSCRIWEYSKSQALLL